MANRGFVAQTKSKIFAFSRVSHATLFAFSTRKKEEMKRKKEREREKEKKERDRGKKRKERGFEKKRKQVSTLLAAANGIQLKLCPYCFRSAGHPFNHQFVNFFFSVIESSNEGIIAATAKNHVSYWTCSYIFSFFAEKGKERKKERRKKRG